MEKSSSLKRAPGALPLLGHSVSLLRDPLSFLLSLPAHGALVEVKLGSSTMIVVCDPELTRQVLRDDAEFDKGGPLVERAREVAGNGIATCPHSRHRRLRRLAQPAFGRDRFRQYVGVIADETTTVISAWRDDQPIDVPAEMLRITLGTALRAMFSSALPQGVMQHSMDDLITVFRGMYWRSIMPPVVNRLPTPGNRRYERARVRLRRTIGTIISDRRGDPVDHGDLLTALLTARDQESDGQGLTEAEVHDEVMTFFIGGQEATANAISWTLYLLARHPAIAQRVRAEADTVFGEDGARTLSLEDLARMDLMRQVITEALRLYPPLWMLPRTTTAPVQLGGHLLPTGTTVSYSPYLLHRRDDLFDDPERFAPERWAPHSPPPVRGSLIPFGAGPRKCLGDQFGMAMATIVLGIITTRWRLETSPGHPPRITPALTLRPRGLRLRAVARQRLPG